MKDPQRLADYVDHIIEAIRRISHYCEDVDNALAHGYFKVDLKIVWLTVQSHLPALFDELVLIKAKF